MEVKTAECSTTGLELSSLDARNHCATVRGTSGSSSIRIDDVAILPRERVSGYDLDQAPIESLPYVEYCRALLSRWC